MTLQNYSLDESKKLNQFAVERGLSDSSKRKYKICLKRYITYFDMTLEDLIDEADNEEETIARENKRKIRERLIEFRVYLKDNYSANTLRTTMSSVNTFYRHFAITVPKLPPITYDKSPNEDIEFTDLPTINHIKQAIENVNTPKHKALFLFIACTGTARNETANFTFGQFRDGIKEYCPNVETPEDIIKALDGKCEGKEPIMPCFKMEREKTHYTYYTIITPECTQFMINYLKNNGLGLKARDTFFQLNVNGITSAFRSLNNKMKWGKKGTIDFFSPHRLRKFNASVIEDNDLANYIQGRKPNRIKEAYFKKDKLRVREEYHKHIHKFGIYSMYDVMINSEAYKQLKAELEEEKRQHQNDNEKYEAQLSKLQESNESLAGRVSSVEDMILSNDINEFKEIVSNHKYIKEDGSLMEIVMIMFKDDYQLDNLTESMENIADELVTRAYLHKKMTLKNNETYLSKKYGKRYNEITEILKTIKKDFIKSLALDEFPQGWNNRIDEELRQYKQEILEKEEKVSEKEITEIMNDIVGLDYVMKLDLINKLKKDNSDNIL